MPTSKPVSKTSPSTSQELSVPLVPPPGSTSSSSPSNPHSASPVAQPDSSKYSYVSPPVPVSYISTPDFHIISRKSYSPLLNPSLHLPRSLVSPSRPTSSPPSPPRPAPSLPISHHPEPVSPRAAHHVAHPNSVTPPKYRSTSSTAPALSSPPSVSSPSKSPVRPTLPTLPKSWPPCSCPALDEDGECRHARALDWSKLIPAFCLAVLASGSLIWAYATSTQQAAMVVAATYTTMLLCLVLVPMYL